MTGRSAQREDGFTLIELVVAMAMAITVVIGLSGIMIVTLHQTKGTLTRVDAVTLRFGAESAEHAVRMLNCLSAMSFMLR